MEDEEAVETEDEEEEEEAPGEGQGRGGVNWDRPSENPRVHRE